MLFRSEREAHEYNTMSELAKSISKLTAVIAMKTGDDGKMFGSVTAGTIADNLKTHFDISIDKKKIHLEHPIRALGEHEVELRLHHDVKATLKVKVESSNPAPAPAPEEPKKDKEEKGGGKERPARGERPRRNAEAKA